MYSLCKKINLILKFLKKMKRVAQGVILGGLKFVVIFMEILLN